MAGHDARESRRFAAGPRATLGANLGLMYLHSGPPDRSWVPSDVLEAFRADLEALSDLSGRPWQPKNIVKYDVFALFYVAPPATSRSSKSGRGGCQKDPQEAPWSGPGRPRRPHSVPRAPWRPSRFQLAKKSCPEASRRPFWTLRGPVLHPPGVDFRRLFFSRKA